MAVSGLSAFAQGLKEAAVNAASKNIQREPARCNGYCYGDLNHAVR